jgi:hypothetical protein
MSEASVQADAEDKGQHLDALRARARQGLQEASLDGRLVEAVNLQSSLPARGPATGRSDASSSQWITEALATHEQREDGLAREISAVREAAAVGASAFIELRSAVQAQLEGLLKQVARLEQDLAATKLELAEVVIDKETSEGNLKLEVEEELLRTRGHFHELSAVLRETLESQVAEVRAEALQAKLEALQAIDKEGIALRQLLESTTLRAEGLREQEQLARDAVAQRLEDRLEAGKEETMSYFHKIDKVMHHETSGVVQKLDNLSRTQAGLEESSRRTSEELRRMTEETSGHARRFQELHEKLEPRVFHLE